MTFIGIAIIGGSLGVILASARIPRVAWGPTICALLLAAANVVQLAPWGDISLAESLLLPLTAFVADALYGGLLWRRLALEPGVSYWGWALRSVTQPGYLRRLYSTQKAEDAVTPSH